MLKNCAQIFSSLLIGLICSLSVHAESTEQMWPGSEYNPLIPTFKSVLGYDVGERISNHGDMLRYFEALERAAPSHIKLFEYGRTWEGRKLIYAAIGNAKVIANLDDFSEKMQKLSDPRLTDKSAAKSLIEQLPSSVWLGYLSLIHI